mmetsp:Transcript_3472/g.10559  ORF Transcript_3472/g.10559 Transcript_3472/m.10559 type:complete len:691 (-) Transcript_3472:61-2133(-)|eukprot:CAMPEP_0177548284 /NCGR_PEP_ID=MMETSP0369-20130122/64371_1 /TAXON_ID=447022 ORGANISM="Scrippsiella hangoei-like, Strain SHHI-4" /NCGR_SAMPLE_ID=MMETSP0369 /ASSEMBLY_ACC=CAM_ASM_000364 /LENGTH=690 /DNA_ID=CAMNT_0019033237 /DNA_START=14 /DNA_END=2086 /DNA_ORIENTATION=-
MSQQRMVEPTLEELKSHLLSLPDLQRRCAQSLLGLAIGDSVGLPFELFTHKFNRQLADEVAAKDGPKELQRLVLELIVERLGRRGPGNAFGRTYSDDTAIADCKMAAIAQFHELKLRPGFSDTEPSELMLKCLLSQLLAWEWGAHHGYLFQGYGGFTKGLLRPAAGNQRTKSMDIREGIQGCQTWPDDGYVKFAVSYCAGALDGVVESWGNGTVMSYAPAVLVNQLLAAAGQPVLGEDVLSSLRQMHLHPHAVQGAALLDGVLAAAVTGRITSTSELRALVRRLPMWTELMADTSLAAHPAYPLRAFDEWLDRGECSQETARTFLLRLTSLEDPPLAPAAEGAYAVEGRGQGLMGQLLRTASNWDDDHGEATGRLALHNGELIRFSQRGLNSVLIAIWCVSHARSCWEWLARLIYVGGDSDTVGAVAGQIAGPLLPASDLCRAFRRFVAVADCPEQRRPCVEVTAAAARRYFSRSLTFCQLRWQELSVSMRLTDPAYVGLTQSCDRVGTRAVGRGEQVRALWLDSAFGTSGGSDGNHRGQRAACERYRAADHLLKAGPRTGIELKACKRTARAIDMLQMSRVAPVDVQPFDIVIVEQNFNNDPSIGIQVLQEVEGLWQDDDLAMPKLVLLTAWRDQSLVDMARDRRKFVLRRQIVLQRHDDVDAIVTGIAQAPCLAAQVPRELFDLSSGQ